ncbi:PQQ-binding-like beta-propeller repeat protein [Flindersiella endophytica]
MTGATALSARPAAAEPVETSDATLSFAVVTDTHANAEEPARTALLARTFAAIERADPGFVLNCGDLTDYGGDGEYDAYLSAIPPGLRPKLRHVPGNHEVRWDVHGQELYHRLFGPAPFAFSAGGLRVAGLDPTQLLQEPGYFGRDHLRWLESELRAARGTPTLLFLHYPFGAEHYYVNDQDDFFATVAGSPLRGVFAGHIHRQQVVRMNGFTQVTGFAAKDGAGYYWAEQVVDAGHPILRVSQVRLADDDSETRTDVTTIPLSGKGEADALRPVRIEVGPVSGGTARVEITLGDGGTPSAVGAQPYPQHIFGGGSAGTWTSLTTTGERTWTGQVDVTAVVPGRHRMQLRLTGPQGENVEATKAFTVPSTSETPGVAWRHQLPGSVQGALAQHGGLVVASTTSGRVQAFRPNVRGANPVWSAQVGPVHRGAAFDAGGRTVFVPSADHHVHALNASNGKSRWRFPAPEPVLSAPLVAPVGGEDLVFFTAGTRLYALSAADGEQRWSSDLYATRQSRKIQHLFAGRVACDGERVYAGGGDGNAYAFDARTGEQAWTFSTTTRTTAYIRLIYGPWDDVIELLPGGQVLVSTVVSAFALDRATGTQRWAVAGSHVYAPAHLVGDDALLLFDEWGKAQLVDVATGAARWQAQLDNRNRVLNAGPVVVGDTAWVVSTTGLLAGVDLASGTIGRRRQLGPANTFSTPVAVEDLLVVGDQAGALTGIVL